MPSVRRVAACVVIALSSSCSSVAPANPTVPAGADFTSPVDRAFGRNAIAHVVVIVQENRTVDNLFNGFPGADTRTYGRNKNGQVVALRRTLLTAPYDMSHKHKSWLAVYDHGKMDGFSTESENCYSRDGHCPTPELAPYGYVPRSEVQPYWDMALQYTFADMMFQSNQGPSFPAHQYLISGTSTIADGSHYRAADNASAPASPGHQGGCNSLPGATVPTIDDAGKPGPSVFPCFARNSIMHDMNLHDVSWRYFQQFGGSGQWHAVDAVRDIWEGPTYESVKYPSWHALEMLHKESLPQVTFVTPSAGNSDHAGRNDGGGPSWVASIVNTIGDSPYWQNTAIIIVWDDWGGWYDHVRPKIFNSYELGFRVPMIVISPYAKTHYVSHVHYEFGSILKFIEKTFALNSLNTTDARANDLTDCFDFTQEAHTFVPIKARFSAEYFEHEPPDLRPVDD